MLRKIVLLVATLALAGVAFTIYTWQEEPPARRSAGPGPLARAPQPKDSDAASKPAQQTMTYKEGVQVPPGQNPVVRVFDENGNERLAFQATEWRPVSDTAFELTEPSIRLQLPGGQMAFVRSDQGHIVVARDDDGNINPKRGRLAGHVQLFVDRSRPVNGKNAPRTSPEEHPEGFVKMWLEENVDFDLDLGRLHCDGKIILQSADAVVEGRGLTLVWDEVDRHIRLLRIEQGVRASLRLKQLVQLGAASPPAEKEGEPRPAQPAPKAKPPANPAEPGAITLTDLQKPTSRPREDRIDTYKITFKDDVIVEQREGLHVVGRLQADLLELVRDFGAAQRSAFEDGPETRPAEEAPGQDPAAAKGRVEVRWSGELVVAPLGTDEDEPGTPGKRFHVTATGRPVTLLDRQTGNATCRKLEYHDETQEVWLTGASEEPVNMQAGEGRSLLGERVYVDRKGGSAKVEGPGRLIDRHQGSNGSPEMPEALRAALAAQAASRPAAVRPAETRPADDEAIEVAWNKGVQIQFALLQMTEPDPAGGPPRESKREYLKHAVFEGQVRFRQPEQTMSAERVEVEFIEPAAAGQIKADRTVAARLIKADGGVTMTREDSVITCDRLEAEMTTDDVGRNVPSIGRAYGHVTAREGRQEIQADDELIVTLASVPRTVSSEQQQRYEAAARVAGYTAESPEWKAFQTRLQNRRDIVVRTMKARGAVLIRDPQEGTEIVADAVDAAFDQGREITTALVTGSEARPARVELADFYVRGPRIAVNVPEQSLEVPGGGLLRLMTNRDLDGRVAEKPVPVVITWKNRMSLRGTQNSGVFTGAVRAVSQNNVLDCRELTLWFADVASETAASRPAGASPGGLPGAMINLVKGAQREETGATRVNQRLRKRLTYADAIGDAVIASSEYEAAGEGPFVGMLTALLPESVKPQPAALPASARKLVSFVRLAGPQIAMDFEKEHLAVEGAGNLFVLENRGTDPDRRAGQKSRPSALLSGSGVADLRSAGPSQTVFTWQSSMFFLNQRNAAVLDDRVIMKHAAGSQIVMPEQATAAMKIDPVQLAKIKGRRAELTCDSLVVHFQRPQGSQQTGTSPLSEAAELKGFQASRKVRLQENERSVEGEQIAFDSESGLIRVEGTPALPARVADLDPDTGALRGFWTGSEAEWNLQTGIVTSKGSNILAPR